MSTSDLVHDSKAARSYASILRSSAIMGASFAAVIVLSFVRMKVMALLVGPSGVGLLGILSTILDLCVAVAGLGLQQSGVRQVAAAGDDEILRTRIAGTLTWLSLGLGVIGGILLLLLALPIAQLSFGSAHYLGAVSLLALALLLRVVTGARVAFLQGARRIATLAQINILAAFVSTAISVPLVFIWREQAVAPVVVVIAAATALVTWSLGGGPRGLRRPPMPVMVREGRDLVNLGLVFMASTLLTAASAYLARIAIVQHAGIESAGLFQAAWAVGVLYSGFILQAMGSDFYPRMSALAADDAAANRLVNEQMRVSILISAPGVLGTITLAQLVMHLFYAAEFEAAATTLRWISLATFLQTLAWPVGFILLAKGARRPFFWLEASSTSLQVALAFLLVPHFGHEGAGMAFCLMYLSHTTAVTYLANRASGFSWSRGNMAFAASYLALICVVFAAFPMLGPEVGIVLGSVVTIVVGFVSLWSLTRLLPAESIPSRLRPVLRRSRAQG
jgi:antigen flippase